jgi:uncharacterized metal-binding protein YceD (DUF177 family)
MRIDLRSLAKGRSIITQNVIMSEEQIRDARIEGGVACRAVVDTLQFQIHLNVSFACRATAECSRCCAPILLQVSGQYRLVLRERHAPRGGTEEEADFLFDADNAEVDTRQALYDEILTSMPMMPLCSPSCRGVQPETTEGTGGGDTRIDPRWEALKRLKDKEDTR